MLDSQPETGAARAERRAQILRGGAWFTALPLDLQTLILQRLVGRRYSTGETVCSQGDDVAGLYGIISGTLHTVGTSIEGDQALLSIQRAGDWTGYIGPLDQQPNSFSFIAASDLEIVILPVAAVQDLFLSRVDQTRALVRPLIQIMRSAYHFFSEINGRSPALMVAQRLIDLSGSVYTPDRPITTDLDTVNQDDLAAATYLTRPTVNRVLQKMAKDGIVRLGYGRIEIIDLPSLFGLAAQDAKGVSEPERRNRVIGAKGMAPLRKPLAVDRLRETLMLGRWFAVLPPDVQEEIIPQLQFRKVDRGGYLFMQGEESEGLYVALSGQFKIFATAQDGRKLLLALAHPGDWAGFAPLLDGNPEPLSCRATLPSQAAFLPRETVEEIFEQNIARYSYLYLPAVVTLRQLYDYLIYTNGKAPIRLVARRLYELAMTPYQQASAPRAFLDNLSQTDIAEATTLSRPSVNKSLGELSKRGIVQIGYGRIKILLPEELHSISLGKTH